MEEKTMLSQGEWRIMNLLWEKKNRTIMEMVEDFAGVTDWDKHTLIVRKQKVFWTEYIGEVLGRCSRQW